MLRPRFQAIPSADQSWLPPAEVVGILMLVNGLDSVGDLSHPPATSLNDRLQAPRKGCCIVGCVVAHRAEFKHVKSAGTRGLGTASGPWQLRNLNLRVLKGCRRRAFNGCQQANQKRQQPNRRAHAEVPEVIARRRRSTGRGRSGATDQAGILQPARRGLNFVTGLLTARVVPSSECEMAFWLPNSK